MVDIPPLEADDKIQDAALYTILLSTIILPRNGIIQLLMHLSPTTDLDTSVKVCVSYARPI